MAKKRSRRPGRSDSPPLSPGKSKTEDGAPKILIVSGMVLLLLAGIVTGYSFIDDALAGWRAKTVLEQMRAEVPAPSSSAPAPSGPAAPDEFSPSSFANTEPAASPALTEDIGSPEPSATLKPVAPQPQYEAIGVLTLPTLALELPVLSEYSDNLLKVSVCRYDGIVSDKPERLMIAGHNYKSHFGKLNRLTAGDEVRFQTREGRTYSYSVIEVADISMYDRDALEQGEWDITLFTCDSDRTRRILVRCAETCP